MTLPLPDIINGGLTLAGSAGLWLNVKTAFRDKLIRGVHKLPTAFFSVGGFWNIYYYRHLNQTFSLACSLSLALANLSWLFLMIVYSSGEKV